METDLRPKIYVVKQQQQPGDGAFSRLNGMKEIAEHGGFLSSQGNQSPSLKMAPCGANEVAPGASAKMDYSQSESSKTQ